MGGKLIAGLSASNYRKQKAESRNCLGGEGCTARASSPKGVIPEGRHPRRASSPKGVIPAEAGTQVWLSNMDSRLRGNDGGPRLRGDDGPRLRRDDGMWSRSCFLLSAFCFL
jgi:hypothetical protein